MEGRTTEGKVMTYWTVYVLGESVGDFLRKAEALDCVRHWRLAFGVEFDAYAREFYTRGC